MDPRIQRHTVQVRSLPRPDWLETPPPPAPVCLVTDDGTATSMLLAHALLNQGWQVVVITLPAVTASAPLPTGVARVVCEDWSEAHLQAQLASITATYGEIGSCIHLHPPHLTPNTSGLSYHPQERAIAQWVFLLAKHLKPSLTAAAANGRSSFLTVSRLDGRFGFDARQNFGAIGGGFFGLTKTLTQEWPTVFCRALDIHPELTGSDTVTHILAELHDPNRCVTEVAYTHQGRATLVCG